MLVFAEYCKYRAKADKPLRLIAGAGLLALLAAGSSLLAVAGAQVVSGLETLFSVIAWILLLVGVLWGVYTLYQK